MRAFISRTFRETEIKEFEAAEYFTGLAEDVGLTVISVEPKAGEKIPTQILNELGQCDIAIGIFTRRHKIENVDGWTIVPNVLIEMGIAKSLNLPVAGFIQSGIPRNELGIIDMEGWNIPQFDTETMYKPKEAQIFKKYLKGSIPDYTELVDTYKFIRFIKEVEVWPDGFGVVTHTCRLKIIDDGFPGVTHMFGLNGNAGKGVELPSFNKMREATSESYKRTLPFFAFRLISSTGGEVSISDIDLVPTSECNKEQIQFELKLKKKPSKDLVLDYEWSTGCYDLFPTSKMDLAPGKRRRDMDRCQSALALGHGGIEDFTFRLVFYGKWEFESPPSLVIYDNFHHPTHTGGSFDLVKGATKYVFVSSKMRTINLTRGIIAAEWIPA
ncbi:MAG: hypothetical protein AB1345_14835 [Chloroflexota bacterium]